MNSGYDTPEQEEAARKLRSILWYAEQQRQRDLAYGETQLFYMKQIEAKVRKRLKTVYWITWGWLVVYATMVAWMLYEIIVRKYGPF